MGIVAGEFPVGKTLPGKDVLMDRFGVSNTALREALKTLEAKGMVAARTRIGYWVREEEAWNLLDEELLAWQLEVGVDHNFISRLFEMRQSIEPVAAALAALRRTEQQAAQLGATVDAMLSAGLDRKRFTELDLQFHLAVIEASGNPMMSSIGGLIGTALAAAFSLSAPTDSLPELQRAHRQHLAIAQAIADQKPQAAADAMLAVIEQGWMSLENETQPAIAIVKTRLFP